MKRKTTRVGFNYTNTEHKKIDLRFCPLNVIASQPLFKSSRNSSNYFSEKRCVTTLMTL